MHFSQFFSLSFITLSILSFTGVVWGQYDACSLCLLLCNILKNETGSRFERSVNIPFDLNSIKNGMHEMPPRKGYSRPPKINEVVEDIVKTCPYTTTDGSNLLNAIERVVLNFYQNNYERINMRNDGGLGLQLLRGQVEIILKQHGDNLTPDVLDLLVRLGETSSRIAPMIMHQSINSDSDPSYQFGGEVFQNNSDILEGRKEDWKSMNLISRHFHEFDKIGEEKEIVYPYLDYHCLVTLVDRCDVPFVCQKMYLTDIYSQYMLMHQVLYQQFAEKKSCVSRNPESFGNVKLFRDRLCSKVYMEAEFLANNSFPTRYIDLFAEQVGFCGLMGYPNFMRADWLREILSWQAESEVGCFLDHYGQTKTTDAEIPVTTIQGRKTTEDTCLVHLTSVSLMAMAMNLRYMVDTCSPQLFSGYQPIFV